MAAGRRLRLLLVALTLVTPLAAASGPAALAADPTDQCTLPPSGTQGQSEFPSCVQVTTSLDRAPARGQTATLNVDLLAALSGSSLVTLELPKGLSFSTLPSGFVETHVSKKHSDGTVATRATGTVDLTAGAHTPLQATVLAMDTTHGQLQARAEGPGNTPGGIDAAFVTVGKTPAKSFLGIDVPPQIKLKQAPAGINPIPTAKFPYRSAGDPSGPPGAQQMEVSAGVACATGAFVYQDKDGNWHPVPNLWVRARNANTFGDSTVASDMTAADGSFNLCFTNDDPNFGESGTVDLYLLARTESLRWNARDDTTTNTFEYKTKTTNDIPDGSMAFGNLTSGDAPFMRPLHIVDEFNNAWGAVPPPCWDQLSSCDQKTIAWSPSSTQWPHMSLGPINTGVVFLPAMGPDFQLTVEHELGHAMMMDVYDGNFPPQNCPNPHFNGKVEDMPCAWAEGFATWFSLHVDQDTWLEGWVPGGPNTTGEDATWGNGWSNGIAVEGRIATALWDIEDNVNEPSWDRLSGGFADIWFTFQHHNSPDFQSFWADRGADGFDTTSVNALATLYQNTIDLGGFQDELPFHTPLQRPDPPAQSLPLPPGTSNDHNWHTQPPFGGHQTWFVDAVRPNAPLALRLRDYTDAAQTVLDGDSSSGVAARIEWIARAIPPFDLWPKVSLLSGSGGYTIETDQNAAVLGVGGADTIFGNVDRPDIVAIRQFAAPAGQIVTVQVRPVGPRSGITDPELFIVSGFGTVVRAGALAGANANGPGGKEEVSFLTPVQGVYGIIVTTIAGSSNYALTIN